METLVLLLGGNKGNTSELFSQAEKLLVENFGEIINQSSLYESQPWGFEAQQWFLNKIVCFQYKGQPPFEILRDCLGIETLLGRERNIDSAGYESRNIDIDILFIGNEVINEKELQIPHPRLHERRFTLNPLHEIMPEFIHPTIGLTTTELLNHCSDKGIVRIYKIRTSGSNSIPNSSLTDSLI